MRFGMPILIEMKSTESYAALCRELGLAFVELNMNLPEYQAENLDVVRFREIADKYGIYYTIHLDENLCPCDFNNKVAAAYTKTVNQFCNGLVCSGARVWHKHNKLFILFVRLLYTH